MKQLVLSISKLLRCLQYYSHFIQWREKVGACPTLRDSRNTALRGSLGRAEQGGNGWHSRARELHRVERARQNFMSRSSFDI